MNNKVSNQMDIKTRIKLFIGAKGNQKVSVYEVANSIGVDINEIKRLINIGEIIEEKGKLIVVEESTRSKELSIIKYLKEHPEEYKFKIPITLGININFVNKMIEEGKLIDENGKLTVNEKTDLKSKFMKVKLYLALNQNAPKHQISAYTGIKIDDINRMIEEGLFVQDNCGTIRENTVIKRKEGNREEFKRQLQNFDTPNYSKNDEKRNERKLQIREGLRRINEERKGFSI